MQRKSIFQLVEENYNIVEEAKKIHSLFYTRKYFCHQPIEDYTFEDILSDFLFDNWRYRGTCISVDEYLERVNAHVDEDDSPDCIVNFLEVMENFIELYRKNADRLYAQHSIGHYSDFESVFCPLVYELEERIGLTRKRYKDRIILYPQNIPLEKALLIVNDEDIQWDLLRYAREKLTLSEKKKLLNNFATKLEIEKSNTKDKDIIQTLIGDCTNILNNLAIRHPNTDGKAQNILKQLSSTEQHELCDLLFSNIITIIILRDKQKYFSTYEKFKALQKGDTK